MEKLPRPVYSSEFCQQAVALITRDGRGIAEAARRLAQEADQPGQAGEGRRLTRRRRRAPPRGPASRGR